VSAPFDTFRAGEDLVRDPAQVVLQQLIEVEAAEVIGRGRYEGTESRVTERNGVTSPSGPLRSEDASNGGSPEASRS
jgi:hypothetical protein